MSWHNPADIKHAEWRTTGWTWTSTTQPRFRLCLILSTGKPSTHALQTPHRSTAAAATWRHSVTVVRAASSQLDACCSLQAANTLIQQLNTQDTALCLECIIYYQKLRALTSVHLPGWAPKSDMTSKFAKTAENGMCSWPIPLLGPVFAKWAFNC